MGQETARREAPASHPSPSMACFPLEYQDPQRPTLRGSCRLQNQEILARPSAGTAGTQPNNQERHGTLGKGPGQDQADLGAWVWPPSPRQISPDCAQRPKQPHLPGGAGAPSRPPSIREKPGRIPPSICSEVSPSLFPSARLRFLGGSAFPLGLSTGNKAFFIVLKSTISAAWMPQKSPIPKKTTEPSKKQTKNIPQTLKREDVDHLRTIVQQVL